MLNRFYVVAKVQHPAQAYSALNRERFDFQAAKLKTETSTYPAVVVQCKDFHDIGVVITLLNEEAGTGNTVYFIDAKFAIFNYDVAGRTIKPVGYTYPTSTTESATLNTHIIIGKDIHSFWESR